MKQLTLVLDASQVADPHAAIRNTLAELAAIQGMRPGEELPTKWTSSSGVLVAIGVQDEPQLEGIDTAKTEPVADVKALAGTTIAPHRKAWPFPEDKAT